MSHGTEGKIYDRVAMTWLEPDEYERRSAYYEELAFQRSPCQGDLTAPMIINDNCGGIHGLQSMQDGRFYDSKSALRRHYKEAGVVEVGNDSSLSSDALASRRAPHKRRKSAAESDREYREIRGNVEKAISQVNLTSYRKDEIT